MSVPHAIAVSSGTSALHLGLRLVGVGPGDLVLVSTLTFIAPANAIRYLHADPIFVDCEPSYAQMDCALVSQFLTEKCERRPEGLFEIATGRRIGAILPVHALGHPVDMDPLLECARRLGVPIVEDATEALGATYKGRFCGTLGDLGCLSFNGNKLITAGGGGMLVTSNPDLAGKARHLSTQAKADVVEYVHDDIGYNYRLSNLQAAVGSAQAERLEEFVAAKRAIAARYDAMLGRVQGIQIMPEAPWAESAFWMYTIALEPGVFPLSRRELHGALAARGIETRPVWQPLHRSPAYPNASRLGGEVADRLHARMLSLPSSTGLTPADQERVIGAIAALGRTG
jgi:perosamine synthetase